MKYGIRLTISYDLSMSVMASKQYLKIYISMSGITVMHTATWLIVLTMGVCFAVPFLLIMLTTYPPHLKLLLATQFHIQQYIENYLIIGT
jgi:hypothetical protein